MFAEFPNQSTLINYAQSSNGTPYCFGTVYRCGAMVDTLGEEPLEKTCVYL